MSNRFRDLRKTRGLTVEVRNDDFGRALRTFSKKVQELGTMQEVKERMGYEKPAVAKQRQKAEHLYIYKEAFLNHEYRRNW